MTQRTGQEYAADWTIVSESERGLTMGKAQYLQKSKVLPPKPIYARMYVQDPLVAEEYGTFVGIKKVKLDGEPYLGQGPTTSRVAVVDYNGDLDTVFKPAGTLARGGGFDVGRKNPRDNFQFHQVNVWAAITRALNHLESPKVFGRRIPWAFPGGRLLVLPHAGYMENAFYDRFNLWEGWVNGSRGRRHQN